MIDSTTEESDKVVAPATSEKPKGAKKAGPAPRRAHGAPAKARAGEKASPAKKSPKSRQSQCRQTRGTRRQQDGQSSGSAAAARRCHRQGTYEGDGLAAAFRTRVPVRDRGKENGAGCDIHQGRGRRASLQRKAVTFGNSTFLDEPEHFLHNRRASVATLRLLFAFGPECRSRSLRNQRSPSPESPKLSNGSPFGERTVAGPR